MPSTKELGESFDPRLLSEAMQRLLKPSLKEQSNALDVARIALADLDKMVDGLRRRRAKVQTQILEDEAELRQIDMKSKQIQEKLDKVTTSCTGMKKERKVMDTQVETSKDVFAKAVKDIHNMIKQTNTNVSRLTKTQVTKNFDDYLKDGTAKTGLRTSKRKQLASLAEQMTGRSDFMDKNATMANTRASLKQARTRKF